MLLIYKYWFAVHCLFIAITLFISAVVGYDIVAGPSSEVGLVGHYVIFMWNTTTHSAIKSAIFGLSNEGMADPQFINVNMLTGKVHYNPKISKTYAGRVDFAGNLTAGRAWFIIKKLQLNDSNEYLARINVDIDTVMSYTVRLQVRQANEPNAERASIASRITRTMKLNETVQGAFGTKSSSSVQSRKVNIVIYIPASILIFIIVLLLAAGTCYWKKRRKEKRGKKSLDTANHESQSSVQSFPGSKNEEELLLKKPPLSNLPTC